MLHRAMSWVNWLGAKVLRQAKTFCPVCRCWSAEFAQFGMPPRKNAQCVVCGALERHRLVWLYFQRKTNLFDGRGKRVLHVAPEMCFENRLRGLFKGEYLTADLNDPRAMIRMDISAIPYPDEIFDVFYCSHVLEYVTDDRLALREIFRVLKPEGWAIILFSVTTAMTTEDPALADPRERCRLYGDDRFRMYGVDYVDRLRGAGFAVTITRADQFVAKEEAALMGLAAAGELAFCRKLMDQS
jgi:SAM-dependent methyltransferase